MGINWWETDPSLQSVEGKGEENGHEQLERENRELRERLERLEQRLGLEQGGQRREEESRAG
jgi:hypothetical protein